ncbi:hypothetical protein SZ25_00890 [Candidatus Arcanobacter lacustris]|uniref:Uncharacterized protein n=1 Tax=Candidatus Arcanibacter lacustris TaxID=1607817 RepID=A0A0F5MMT4_9RICK|nr:hypothetical protein SZ25_00890 [Candidatus Arcanobacter lacustris]
MLDKIMYDNTSKTGDTEILTSLIDMGCDVNKEYKDSQKKRSYTPIQLVLEKSAYIDHGVVELLINRGAIVTQNDIEIARERNDDDIVIGEKTIELLEKTLGLQSYYQGDNIHKEVDDFIKNVYQEAKKNNDHTYLIEKYRELDLNQRD